MSSRIASLFEDYRGFPREASTLIYASFFTWAAAGLFFISLQVFLLLEGLSFATSSLILGTFGIVSASSTLLFGGLADRYGKKKFVLAGGILSALSLAIFALDTNVPDLFGAATLAGLSEAAFASSWSALLADKAGNVKRTSAFGLSFFVATVSSALGGFSTSLLDLLKSAYNIDLVQGNRYLFVSVAAVSLIGPAMVYFRVSDTTVELDRSRGFHILPGRKSRGVVFRYSIAGIIIALGAGMVIPLVPGWAFLKFGLANDITGPIFGGVNSLVMGFANLATPRLAKRFGTVRTIVLTQGSSTAFLFSVPFAPNFVSASSIYIVRSMLMMMSNPAQNSLLMGLVPAEERSIASGITAALWRLPNSFSTSIGGYIMGLATSNGVTNTSSIYLALPFVICTGLYLTAITYFWRSFKDVKLPEEQALTPISEPIATAMEAVSGNAETERIGYSRSRHLKG